MVIASGSLNFTHINTFNPPLPYQEFEALLPSFLPFSS